MYKFLIGLLLVASTLYADLITTFEFDFDETSPTWTPPGEDSGIFYYNLAYFTVDTSGSWTASNTSILSHDSYDYSNGTPFSEADTFIYVYENTFDTSDVKKNLFAEDDDGYDGGNTYQFELTENLTAGTTYWAAITSYDAGEYISGTVDISGPTGSSINMTIIPEPAAVGLLMSGAALILLFRKRV
jgi:hypothetical protein